MTKTWISHSHLSLPVDINPETNGYRVEERFRIGLFPVKEDFVKKKE